MPQPVTNPIATLSKWFHVSGDQPEILDRVTDPDVNLSLWQRPARTAVVHELTTLRCSSLTDVRLPTSPDSFDTDVNRLLQQQRLDPEDFPHLRADLNRLARIFFRIIGARKVRFRLITTSSDDCRRFHVDRMHLRLLCTYRGPGTEWLTDTQVDRVSQARGAPNDAIIRFGEPSRFEPFWVGVMKGDPDNLGEGLVHRSPPIAGTGHVRVLFCLDC